MPIARSRGLNYINMLLPRKSRALDDPRNRGADLERLEQDAFPGQPKGVAPTRI